MANIYLNNWQTKTTAAVDSSTNYIPVPASAIESLKAAGLPDLSGADGLTTARLTLANPTTGLFEILYCLGYQGQTLACERGFENDAPAREWPAGTLVYMSLTAADIATMWLLILNNSKNIADLYKAGSGSGGSSGGSTGGGTQAGGYSKDSPSLWTGSTSDPTLDLTPFLNRRAVYNWYPTYPNNGRGVLLLENYEAFYNGVLDVDFRLGIGEGTTSIAIQTKNYDIFGNVAFRRENPDDGTQHFVVDVTEGSYQLSLRHNPMEGVWAVLTRLNAPS